MKLLRIDSAITGEGSVSRKLTADVVSRLRQAHPAIEVAYRDLVAEPLDHLTLADMPPPGQSTPVLEQFLAADVVVVGAPMYNFTLPTQLKAWIDRILVAGKTFRYSETGPVGLVASKRIIIAVARGDLYSAGSPSAAAEHLETYLRTAFGFVGATPEFVIAEGMLIGPDVRAAAIANADQAVAALAT